MVCFYLRTGRKYMQKTLIATLFTASVFCGADAMLKALHPIVDAPFPRGLTMTNSRGSGESEQRKKIRQDATRLWNKGIRENDIHPLQQALEKNPEVGSPAAVLERLSAAGKEKDAEPLEISDAALEWIEGWAAKFPHIAYDWGVSLREGLQPDFGRDRKIKIKKNEEEGLKWLKIAAREDDYLCACILGTFVLRGDEERVEEFAGIYAAADPENPMGLARVLLSGSFGLAGKEQAFPVVQKTEEGLAMLRTAANSDFSTRKFLGFLLIAGKIDDIRIERQKEEGLTILRQIVETDLQTRWQVGIMLHIAACQCRFDTASCSRREEEEGLAMLCDVARADPRKAQKLGRALQNGYMLNPLDEEGVGPCGILFPYNELAGRSWLAKGGAGKIVKIDDLEHKLLQIRECRPRSADRPRVN
jgi:hypothetical protein